MAISNRGRKPWNSDRNKKFIGVEWQNLVQKRPNGRRFRQWRTQGFILGSQVFPHPLHFLPILFLSLASLRAQSSLKILLLACGFSQVSFLALWTQKSALRCTGLRDYNVFFSNKLCVKVRCLKCKMVVYGFPKGLI